MDPVTPYYANNDSNVYLGNYNREERWGEKVLEKLREMLGLEKNNTQNPPQESPTQAQPDEPRQGPMAEVTKFLREIAGLEKETKDYSKKHINQDFRRINATLLEIQVKLDKVNYAGDAEVKAAVKKGIIKSEDVATLLMSKIHSDYKKCTNCLRL